MKGEKEMDEIEKKVRALPLGQGAELVFEEGPDISWYLGYYRGKWYTWDDMGGFGELAATTRQEALGEIENALRISFEERHYTSKLLKPYRGLFPDLYHSLKEGENDD